MAAPVVHAINWFEIPVSDFDRAKIFYETVLGRGITEKMVDNTRMGLFEHDREEEGRGGAIVYDPEFYTPSTNGTLVYLNCEPDIQRVLDRIPAAGGEVLQGKTIVHETQDLGFWALIRDTEGNRVALHSME